jgi:hypothetical protein
MAGRDLKDVSGWQKAVDPRVDDQKPLCFRAAPESRPVIAVLRPRVRLTPRGYLIDGRHSGLLFQKLSN